MKITLKELKSIVEQGVSEALDEAKKKKKDDAQAYPIGIVPGLSGSKIDPALDHSHPQGVENRLRKQGQSGMGPWTAESLVREYVKRVAASVLTRKK